MHMSGLLNRLPEPASGCVGFPWTSEVSPEVYSSTVAYPTLSIVTATLNQGPFLEHAIRSVLLQNYPNLEYIVFDGGSTDETVSVLKKYSDFLTFWSSETDTGQSNAINKGLQRI